ncbi:polynucleotide kinase 3 phosphatase-domain-containing protein [Syncephalis fuscata]|nr:polynucleotide kinase 3 phosphatase-domain-containing protein [Syncephalis fuscata]
MPPKRKSDKETHSKEEQPTKKLHPFFMPKTKQITWQDDHALLYGRFNDPAPRERVAAFDLDGTIYEVRGSHTHAKHADDWQWTFECVPERVRQLYEEGYQIVFFSNQNGIRNTRHGTTNPKKLVFKEKLERVLAQLNVPVQVYAALQKDIYRKPRIGMWDSMMIGQRKIIVDTSKSFYVGDAAGRPFDWAPGKAKDHSDCDRKFAGNIGLPFYTPEEYFMKETPAIFSMDGINPKEYIEREFPTLDATSIVSQLSNDLEVVVFAGMPASGKTSFYRKWFAPANYVHINQDNLRTKQRCSATAKEALSNGKSVVIDNTNPAMETRRDYIQLARDHGAKVRCFYFNTDPSLARHNNVFRAFTAPLASTDAIRNSLLPDVVFHTYRGQFVEPKIEEGFDEVKTIEFIPDFTCEMAKAAWMQWHL